MRGPEGSDLNQRRFSRQLVSNGIDLSLVKRFRGGHSGQDSRDRAGQQGLAWAGPAVQQHKRINGPYASV